MSSQVAKPAAPEAPGLRECVRLDLWRCQGGSSAVLFARTWFQDPAFRPVFTLRLIQHFAARRGLVARVLELWARLWHRRTQARCGVDVPATIRVGPGFKILHGWGVVINRDVSMGANVTIMQGVTIGGTRAGVPHIGDDVIVCANATVVGPVTLGSGAVVGAGCVVTRDVGPDVTVVGNPQREIPRKAPPKPFNPIPVRR